ncbi:hypothetical protein [Maribacter sp. 2308TA10-17]|uniref:hypothetical protein n=1 Tax=Maribacter sp. 2308TA10-17 TaxID=3386276 RepID=UPI0039BC9495
MKNIALVVFAASLFGCSSQKKLEVNDIPFTLGKSTVQEWLGGKKESGSGANLKIEISDTLKEVSFQKVYFRARALDCTTETEGNETYVLSSYKTGAKSEETLRTEGKKMQKAFDIKPTEAVLEYTSDDGKTHYVKVSGIKEMAPEALRSMPKN